MAAKARDRMFKKEQLLEFSLACSRTIRTAAARSLGTGGASSSMRERRSERTTCSTIRRRFANRAADSFKTSEGVSTLPLSLYSCKKPSLAHRRGKTVIAYQRICARICDKVERSQELTPERDTQSASPDIIAVRRKAESGADDSKARREISRTLSAILKTPPLRDSSKTTEGCSRRW
jgi:hypothetical protein